MGGCPRGSPDMGSSRFGLASVPFHPLQTSPAALACRMVPAGYLLKRTQPPPGWFETGTSHITEVCSLSDCVNDNVVKPQDNWKHNGFGLANSPGLLFEMAQQKGGVETSGSKLFFYSAYEHELDSDGWAFDPGQWQPLSRAASSEVRDEVTLPSANAELCLLGYDVVVFGVSLSTHPYFATRSPRTCR